MLEAAREHATAEAMLDMDRTLATLVEEPVFEFFPAGLTLRGRALIETFYRERYATFASSVVGFELHGEWANGDTAIQEYGVDVKGPNGTQRFRVVSMTPVREDGLLFGERLYCDVGFLHALLGPLFEHCQPVEETESDA